MILNGVPRETIILLLMLPIAATIIAFARQIIGIKGFGIYTPLIISFAFLTTGLKYGLVFFAAIIITGTFMRHIVKHFRLLYLPRMAIVLTAVAVSMLVIFAIGGGSHRNGLINVSIFAILIMITLVEKFVTAQIERGAKRAVILTIETLILSITCFWVASWMWLQNVVVIYPAWIILATIIINIFLGKWTGLRFSEYFRFIEVIKQIELPERKKES
ncbi:7TM domain-containing protein [Patescibacteria group bacterium]